MWTFFFHCEGEDIAGFTAAKSVSGKHLDVVCGGFYLDDGGLGLVGAEMNGLPMIP